MQEKKQISRIIALLLVAVLTMGVLPLSVAAVGELAVTGESTIDFGTAYLDYTQPAAQTRTISAATTTQLDSASPTQLTITPTLENFEVTFSPTGLTDGVRTTIMSIRPKANLPVGDYTKSFTVGLSGRSESTNTLTVKFVVEEPTVGVTIENAADTASLALLVATTPQAKKKVIDDFISKNITGNTAYPTLLLNNSDVRAAIGRLEAAYRLQANADVTPQNNVGTLGISSFGAVGAILNMAPGQKEQLTVDYPTTLAHVDSTLYSKAVQVEINLGGVQNNPLKSPLFITVSIPAGIDANKLRILHYGEIVPCDKNGDGTVSFVATSLSPFVFAQYDPYYSGGAGTGTGATSGYTHSSGGGSSSSKGYVAQVGLRNVAAEVNGNKVFIPGQSALGLKRVMLGDRVLEPGVDYKLLKADGGAMIQILLESGTYDLRFEFVNAAADARVTIDDYETPSGSAPSYTEPVGNANSNPSTGR